MCDMRIDRRRVRKPNSTLLADSGRSDNAVRLAESDDVLQDSYLRWGPYRVMSATSAPRGHVWALGGVSGV
jgi:hypothetical protein